METKKNPIYNLIILDESGSMHGVCPQTISGCNETLNIIRSSQKKFAETQEHLVSIYVFQDGDIPSRYLIKNTPIEHVRNITGNDYKPWGSTPLNDAVGMTLSDLKSTMYGKEDAVANVTIITDGYENSSREYSGEKVRQVSSELKELCWNFNFIGANIDVESVAKQYEIDNYMAFKQDDEGMKQMWAKEKASRMAYNESLDSIFSELASPESVLSVEALKELKKKRLKECSKGYFDKG